MKQKNVDSNFTQFFKRNWIYSIFSLFCLLIGFMMFVHEPWYDEAQSWLLARDSSFLGLLTHNLRYEGSPGLWHFILMIPAKLGLPYVFLNITSGIIAMIGVYVFLRYSPFPGIIKILFPFSYFIFYQYAVVSRAYVFLPLFLFLLAIIYQDKTKKIYQYTILLILISLTSIHGVIIAGSLVTIHLLDLKKEWKFLSHNSKNKQIINLVMFIIVIILIVVELSPPKDLIIAGVSGNNFIFHPFKGIFENLYMFTDAFTTNVYLSRDSYLTPSSLVMLTFSTLLVYITIKWFWQNKTFLLFLLPCFGLFLLFQKYCSPWHLGIVFLIWIFALWITFAKNNVSTPKKGELNFRREVVIIVVLILSIQSYWSFCSLKNDYFNKYTSSREVAKFIKAKHLDNKKIYIHGYRCLEILPYFKRNIFINHNNGQPQAYMQHSQSMFLRANVRNILKEDPDILIIDFSQKRAVPPTFQVLNGYRLIRYFRSQMYWKDKTYLFSDFFVFVKTKSVKMNIKDVGNFVQWWNDEKI